MDMDIEKRLAALTPFAREQVDSTWLGGTPKRDWLIVGLLLETLEDLLVRFCERFHDKGHGEWDYDVIFMDDGNVRVRTVLSDTYSEVRETYDKKNPIDALVELINAFALRLEPTDQEKRDDAEVSAAC